MMAHNTINEVAAINASSIRRRTGTRLLDPTVPDAFAIAVPEVRVRVAARHRARFGRQSAASVACAGRRRARIRDGSYEARIIGRAVAKRRLTPPSHRRGGQANLRCSMRDFQKLTCRYGSGGGRAVAARHERAAIAARHAPQPQAFTEVPFDRACAVCGVAQPLRLRRRLAVVQQLLAACRTQHARIAARGGIEMNLMNHVNAFVRDEEGQDLIEYALLVALISLVCVLALTEAGTQVNNIFTAIKDKLTDAAAPAA
jgi:pilus assembly protein Flp/PilA